MEQQAKTGENFEYHEKMSKTKRHRTRFSNDQLAFLETQFNSVTHYSENFIIRFFNFFRVY